MQFSVLPKSVENVIDEFSRLPGIGPKSAARLAFHLLKAPQYRIDNFSQVLLDLKKKTHLCVTCNHLTEYEECEICTNPKRNHAQICVVSDPLDIVALERTHDFKGVYHVLHGEISPMNGVGPRDIKIDSLKKRVSNSAIEEVVLATNPTMEGETTALYIAKILSQFPNISLTRIARGLPVGGGLEYADEVTLSNALMNRKAFHTLGE